MSNSMVDSNNKNFIFFTHEQYTKIFDALSHPARIKILGILLKEKQYVSELARMVNISRALLYMHLKKLESAGLILGHAEISSSGKAIKYYEAVIFEIAITPSLLITLSETIEIIISKDTQE